MIIVPKFANPISGLLGNLVSGLELLRDSNKSLEIGDSGDPADNYSSDLELSIKSWLDGSDSYYNSWIVITDSLSGTGLPSSWPNNSNFKSDYSLFSIISLVASSSSLGGNDISDGILEILNKVQGPSVRVKVSSLINEVDSVNKEFELDVEGTPSLDTMNSLASSLNSLGKIPSDVDSEFSSLGSYLSVLGVQRLLENIFSPNPLGEPAVLPDWFETVNKLILNITGKPISVDMGGDTFVDMGGDTSVDEMINVDDDDVNLDEEEDMDVLTAPVFSSSSGSALSVGVGEEIDFLVPSATGDPDPVYTATGLPDGVLFDASNRRVQGDTTTAGSGTITITATNSEGMATYTIDWEISVSFITQEISIGSDSNLDHSSDLGFFNNVEDVDINSDFMLNNVNDATVSYVIISADGELDIGFGNSAHEFKESVETAEDFITIRSDDGSSVTVDGPNNPSNIVLDDDSHYQWTPLNISEVIDFYNGLTGSSVLTLVFSIPE